MSKKRDRKKSQECQCSVCQNKSGKSSSGLNNNPFGINPSQLMGMLGNIDMGQIGNLLSSMNKDGFDLNNLNLGAIQNMMPGMSGSNGMNGFSGMNGGQKNQDLSPMEKIMSEIDMKDNQGLSSVQDMIANMGNLQGMQSNVNNKEVINNSSKKESGRDNIGNNKKNKNKENVTDVQVDENIEMLMSIRKIVNYDKAKFIDKVIELYNNGVFEDQ